MSSVVVHRPPVCVSLGLLAWAVVASAVALAGLMPRLGPPVVAAAIGGGVALGLLARRTSPAARAWTERVSLRGLVLYQAVRAPIGGLFLWLHAHGRMPAEFAQVAGWGDIIAGLGALLAAACLPATTRRRRAVVLLWNAVGLLDILVVVATAQKLMLLDGRDDMLAGFLALPLLPVIPLFLVPTVILAHLVVFARLRR